MNQQKTPTYLGDTTAPAPRKNGPVVADWIAVALTALWLLLAGMFFVVLPGPETSTSSGGTAQFLMTMLAIFLPIALIWVATTAAKNAKLMHEESSRLQAAIDAMRHAYVSQAPQQANGIRPPLEQKLDEIARAQKKTEAALAHLTSVNARMNTERAALAAAPRPDLDGDKDQKSLALGSTAEENAAPITTEEFIRAMNFPEDERDREGFRCLRLALKDHRVAPLVRSAQDILTLLAEDRIYMDDLAPDRAKPEIWRKFADGERGRTVAGLGGIRDRTSLALAAGRMRQDPVFRDCSHHFLRKFDTTFQSFEKGASDGEIIAFADTRSARAFMLIGRVSGTFD